MECEEEETSDKYTKPPEDGRRTRVLTSDKYTKPPKNGRRTRVLVAKNERNRVVCDRARESTANRKCLLYRILESNRSSAFFDALNFFKDEV